MIDQSKQLKLFNPWEFKGSPENFVPSQDLELNRNARALRLPKQEAQTLVNHPLFRSLVVYIRLKPLYISGVIKNDNGHIPYKKIADFCGLSLSGTRGKIKDLKNLGLVHIDYKRNIILGSWQKFTRLIGSERDQSYKHKYTFLNNKDIDLVTFLRCIAYLEGRSKQIYRFVEKECILQTKLSLFDLNKNKGANYTEVLEQYANRLDNPRYIKRITKKLKKRILGSWDYYIKRAESRFYPQSEQRLKAVVESNEYLRKHNLGENIRYVETYPDVNPFFTYSCKGLADLLGKSSQGSGYYIQQKMFSQGLIEIFNHYHDTNNNSLYYEINYDVRKDAYIKKRPPRDQHGRPWILPYKPKTKFRIVFPNLLEPKLFLENC